MKRPRLLRPSASQSISAPPGASEASKAWQRSTGLGTPEGERPGPEFYYGPFITCLIATIAVAMIAKSTGSDTVGDGIVLGLVAGIGISGAVLAVTGLFDTKKPDPKVSTAISIGYHLVGLVVAAVIVSVWT